MIWSFGFPPQHRPILRWASPSSFSPICVYKSHSNQSASQASILLDVAGCDVCTQQRLHSPSMSNSTDYHVMMLDNSCILVTRQCLSVTMLCSRQPIPTHITDSATWAHTITVLQKPCISQKSTFFRKWENLADGPADTHVYFRHFTLH